VAQGNEPSVYVYGVLSAADGPDISAGGVEDAEVRTIEELGS